MRSRLNSSIRSTATSFRAISLVKRGARRQRLLHSKYARPGRKTLRQRHLRNERLHPCSNMHNTFDSPSSLKSTGESAGQMALHSPQSVHESVSIKAYEKPSESTAIAMHPEGPRMGARPAAGAERFFTNELHGRATRFLGGLFRGRFTTGVQRPFQNDIVILNQKYPLSAFLK